MDVPAVCASVFTWFDAKHDVAVGQDGGYRVDWMQWLAIACYGYVEIGLTSA